MILLLYSVSREKEKRERFSPRVEASVTLIRPLQIKTKEERKTPGRRTALPLGSVNSKSAAKYERIEPNGESVVRHGGIQRLSRGIDSGGASWFGF